MPDLSQWTAGLFIPQHRSIGGIVAQVTISEQERDELTITEHPVQQGAPISDHAFKRPSEVTIRAGWSAGLAGDLSANGNGVYGLLLAWQAALRPFKLYTGKRMYEDMLIQSLTVMTDERSEFALMADIVCRQVIIVSTSTTQVSQSGSGSGDSNVSSNNPGNMDNPQDNAPSTNNGEAGMRNFDVVDPAAGTQFATGGFGTQYAPNAEMTPAEQNTLTDQLTLGPEATSVQGQINKDDPSGEVSQQKLLTDQLTLGP